MLRVPCPRLYLSDRCIVQHYNRNIYIYLSVSLAQTCWQNPNLPAQPNPSSVCEASAVYDTFLYPIQHSRLLTYKHFSDDDKKLFLHVRKSYLVNEENLWIKKENENFDVAQGAFDSAEVRELVGLFLLSQMTHLSINPGLFRDDGLQP